MSNAQDAGRPLVSVVVTTRNEAALIGTLLRSLRAQTHSRLEIILVDNFSTDETCALARRYVDQLIQAGPERSAQRNLGARMAAGPIVMFLDADMQLEPGVVAEAVALFQAQPGGRMASIPERSVGHNFWARCKALERNCYVDEPSVMAARVFDRRFFLELGGFDESLTGPEDWDLTQRAQSQAQMLILRQCLWHDEGQIELGAQLRKKYHYAQSFLRYARKHPAHARRQANLIFRPAFLRHWRELARHPLSAAGMIALRLLEGLAGLTGILVQQFRARPDQRPDHAG
jgi:hypothetical protein